MSFTFDYDGEKIPKKYLVIVDASFDESEENGVICVKRRANKNIDMLDFDQNEIG